MMIVAVLVQVFMGMAKFGEGFLHYSVRGNVDESEACRLSDQHSRQRLVREFARAKSRCG